MSFFFFPKHELQSQITIVLIWVSPVLHVGQVIALPGLQLCLSKSKKTVPLFTSGGALTQGLAYRKPSVSGSYSFSPFLWRGCGNCFPFLFIFSFDILINSFLKYWALPRVLGWSEKRWCCRCLHLRESGKCRESWHKSCISTRCMKGRDTQERS